MVARMSPAGILLLLFLLVPLVEIYLLIEVGSLIGALPTVAAVVGTAVLGVFLLRIQGWATLQRTRLTLARGELPALEVMEGVLLLVAGALLLTPGFFTDFIGFGLLVPRLRRGLVQWFMRRSDLRLHPMGQNPNASPQRRTIEGEYRREDD